MSNKIKTIEELKQLQEIEIVETQAGKREVISHTWSALLENSCPLCTSLDGKTMEANDPLFHQFQPPLHPHCKCLWWSTVITDPNPPEINWKTPSNELIKDYGMNVKQYEKEIIGIDEKVIPISTLLIPISEKEKKKKIIKNIIEPLD